MSKLRSSADAEGLRHEHEIPHLRKLVRGDTAFLKLLWDLFT